MNAIFSRKHDSYSDSVYDGYQNFAVIFDGDKPALSPCEPVAPALAAETSVLMNAMRNGKPQSGRSRLNVDAVDLKEEIKKRS